MKGTYFEYLWETGEIYYIINGEQAGVQRYVQLTAGHLCVHYDPTSGQ
jgi:hypothetical protein